MKTDKSIFRLFHFAFFLWGLLVFGIIPSGCNDSDSSNNDDIIKA